MLTPRTRSLHPAQGGFSMVEFLMTAFIMAIGILGLTMLQVMSLKTSRGGRSLTTAVQVADRVMDQMELEGRLTWLNRTDSQYSTTTDLTGLTYIGKATIPAQTFNLKGQLLPLAATPADPTDSIAFYTVTITRVAQSGSAPIGQMHDYTVRVAFADGVDAAGTTNGTTRSVTLTRRILHA